MIQQTSQHTALFMSYIPRCAWRLFFFASASAQKKTTKYNNTHAQCACDDDDTHRAQILQKGIVSERSYLSFVIPIR